MATLNADKETNFLGAIFWAGILDIQAVHAYAHFKKPFGAIASFATHDSSN